MGWTLAISRLSRVKQRCFEVGTWCLLFFITRAGSRFWVARQQPAWEWWRPRAKVQVRGIGRGVPSARLYLDWDSLDIVKGTCSGEPGDAPWIHGS